MDDRLAENEYWADHSAGFTYEPAPHRTFSNSPIAWLPERDAGGVEPVESPQTYRYFTSVLSHAIADRAHPGRPVRRLGANVFETRASHGRTVVVMRFCSKALSEQLIKNRPDRLLLFVDDNIWALKGAGLPEGYRYRLARKRETIFAPLLAVADEIVAPSRRILARFDDKGRALVSPSLCGQLPSLAHHDQTGPVRIVFDGDRSHTKDLDSIAGELMAVLGASGDVTLTTFLGRHAPAALRGSNIHHLDPMSWPKFRDFAAANHFHISLHPAQTSEFCLSRSTCGFLRSAGWGATGLYAAQEPFTSIVDDGHSGFLVDKAPGSWQRMLTALIADRTRLRTIALAAQQEALAIGDPMILRRFWVHRLGLPFDYLRPHSSLS
jgi:hypothetical protein